jgi:hypothetical protein
VGVADREMAVETCADVGQGFPAAVRADRQRSTSDEAVDDIAWSNGEVLVVESRSAEPVSRVFPSSRATKILTTPRCPSSSLRAVAVEGPTAS